MPSDLMRCLCPVNSTFILPLKTGYGTRIGTDASYKSFPTFAPESKTSSLATYFTPDMPLFDYRLILDLIAPAKQVEYSGRQLQRARALFEEHQAVMDPHDHQLAQSFLER